MSQRKSQIDFQIDFSDDVEGTLNGLFSSSCLHGAMVIEAAEKVDDESCARVDRCY